MSRTGHSSVNGVPTYKHKVDMLQDIVSDMLNTRANIGSVDKSTAKSSKVVENRYKIVRSCDGIPAVNASEGSNVSINISL